MISLYFHRDIASAIKDLLSAVNMAFRKYESREKKKVRLIFLCTEQDWAFRDL